MAASNSPNQDRMLNLHKRICQILTERSLSSKIWQKKRQSCKIPPENGLSGESARKVKIWQNRRKVILQDFWAEKRLYCKILIKRKEFFPVELHSNSLIISDLLKIFFSVSYFLCSCLIDLIKEHKIYLKRY